MVFYDFISNILTTDEKQHVSERQQKRKGADVHQSTKTKGYPISMMLTVDIFCVYFLTGSMHVCVCVYLYIRVYHCTAPRRVTRQFLLFALFSLRKKK